MVILTIAPHFGHVFSITLVLIYTFYLTSKLVWLYHLIAACGGLDNPAGGGVERNHGLTPYLIAEGSGDRREPMPEAGVNYKR